MSAKPILEAAGKTMISDHLSAYGDVPGFKKAPAVSVFADTDMDALPKEHPWLLNTPLVAKIDQGVKRRGKLGLIKVNTDFAGAKAWIGERVGQVIKAGDVSGRAQSFIIEPCLPHDDADEMYVCLYGTRQGQTMLFYHEGGIEVGDVDSKVEAAGTKVSKEVDVPLSDADIDTLLAKVSGDKKAVVAPFLHALYKLYVHLNFTYLEINPLVIKDGQVHVLDLAAKIDETAGFEQQCKDRWGNLSFPAPFGREKTKEELYISELDARSGASLKLTVLNKDARIWTMVAGGGASVVYADTICDLVDPHELANYGEYSGAPNEEQTYNYARTILDLMTRNVEKKDKVLIIGGGIANFTNVAQTFKGIVHAIKDYQHLLAEQGVRILVRRGGPNYQEGLEMMRKLADTTGLPITVKGPETHITAIVRTALDPSYDASQARPNFQVDVSRFVKLNESRAPGSADPLFTNKTRSVVFGLQDRAIQGMLDFDKACNRDTPSVAAVIYPFGSHSQRKYYWGDKEILLPVYPSIAESLQKHPEVSVFVNFASFRSAHEVTLEALQLRGIKTVAIIAEGIPENRTKEIIMQANMRGVNIIGPATVGGIKPGCFKVGNTGGMLDNNIESLLYRPGSVAYVSRSGGMSNELNNILSKNSDGVFEGVAIGGDRYPCTTFLDHLLRWENTEEVKMMVLLGEVGGVEEHRVAQLMKEGKITKPLVAWCIGTCASRFTTDVQFGHAGALANSDSETAVAKNKALADAGAFVPPTFDDLGTMVNSVYSALVDSKVVKPVVEPPKPKIPMDFKWAKELGLIRKPAAFMSSISDERGDELRYAGVPISEVFSADMGIGGVVGLLWFKRQLPPYACKFIEMCLMITADHGPAVSGAHNVIVTARAGKDLISALCSGLLTIGDRFGGALDDAARQFTNAFDDNISAPDFVKKTRQEHKLIMGIGHRVKSLENPDMRVKLVKEFVKNNFPSSPILDFAMQVELVTTQKKDTLILNVDGCIAVAFCDLMRSSGCFTHQEANEYIQIGVLNGLFVLGRSLGFIGHWIDQKRLKQDLYRHPWDDIMYLDEFTIPQSPRSGS